MDRSAEQPLGEARASPIGRQRQDAASEMERSADQPLGKVSVGSKSARLQGGGRLRNGPLSCAAPRRGSGGPNRRQTAARTAPQKGAAQLSSP